MDTHVILRSLIGLLMLATVSSCSSSKTVFISNKMDHPIRIIIDNKLDPGMRTIFRDSLNGRTIEEKMVISFGEGKWSKQDKSDLERVLQEARIIEEGSTEEATPEIKVKYISLNVEELWVIMKKQKE